MAGSLNHCLTDDRKSYRGTDLLENMRDMGEDVEEMAFIILAIRQRWGGAQIIDDLSDRYFRCLRKEEPWPDFMQIAENDDGK